MKFNTFKEFLGFQEFQESVKEKEFKIEIDNKEYTIIRDSHLRIKRGNDTKPKDFKMTKNKYRKLFEEVLKVDFNHSSPVTVTWVKNNKSNAISFEIKDDLIRIFGAIMNSSLNQDLLYAKAKQRLKISLD